MDSALRLVNIGDKIDNINRYDTTGAATPPDLGQNWYKIHVSVRERNAALVFVIFPCYDIEHSSFELG